MIDGHAAAQTLLGYGDGIDRGYCLHYVWQAYKTHGARTDRSAPTALVGWERSDGKHPGDRNPPAGVPVWWGRRYDGNTDGDVVISLGGGRVVATDWPSWGVVGITTIDEREAQIGREYLGWTEAIFDVPVYAPPAPHPTPAPSPAARPQIGEEPMFIAEMPNGWFLVVPQGAEKPRAVVLDGGSGAAFTNIPRLKFETEGSIRMLTAAVVF